MKKIGNLFIKFMSKVIFMCTVVSLSQCCTGKMYQVPESKEFREKVLSRIKD